MTTKMLEKRINNLSKEVARLRSILIGTVQKDFEGEYKPKFIKEIIKARLENSIYEYIGRGSLLKLHEARK